MTINFYLKDKNEAKTAIILHLRAGKRLRWSIRESINPSAWDNTKQRPKRRHSDYMFLTSLMDKCSRSAKEYYQSSKLLNAQISQSSFTEHMNKAILGIGLKPDLDFFAFAYGEITKERQMGSIGQPRAKALRSIITRVKEFAEVYHKKVDFDTMDSDFFANFSEWQLKRSGTNRLATMIGVIKKYLRMAEKSHDVNKAFKDVTVKKAPTDRVFLTLRELEMPLSIELSKVHQEVYDMFLIGALTGFRFSDFTAIHKMNLVYKKGQAYLLKRTKKVNRKVYVPVHPLVLDVLNKYDTMPEFKNTTLFNRKLKVLFKRAGLTDEVVVSKNIKGEMIDQVGPKYEFLSSHTARTSFITNLLIEGVHDRIVMDMAGISTFKTLQRYQRLKPSESAEIGSRSDFFKRTAV